MKKPVLILLFLLFSNLAYGQKCCPYINVLKVVPENPTVTDSIYLIIQIATPKTSHKIFVSNHDFRNDSFIVNRCYQIGVGNQLSMYFDTILLGNLPTGNYLVHLTASVSPNEENCFYLPHYTRDSVYTFEVGTVNSQLLRWFSYEIKISPNPAQNFQNLTISLEKPAELEITLHDISGRLIKTIHKGKSQAGEATFEADLSFLPSGIFFYRIKNNDTVHYHKAIKL